jgi:hypothetical protein
LTGVCTVHVGLEDVVEWKADWWRFFFLSTHPPGLLLTKFKINFFFLHFCGGLLGKWIYCVGEDSMLYIFDALSGILENVLELTDKEGREVN